MKLVTLNNQSVLSDYYGGPANAVVSLDTTGYRFISLSFKGNVPSTYTSTASIALAGTNFDGDQGYAPDRVSKITPAWFGPEATLVGNDLQVTGAGLITLTAAWTNLPKIVCVLFSETGGPGYGNHAGDIIIAAYGW